MNEILTVAARLDNLILLQLLFQIETEHRKEN